MQVSRSGSEHTLGSSITINGWKPQRDDFESTRVDIDFSDMNIAGLTPSLQWQRMADSENIRASATTATANPLSSDNTTVPQVMALGRRQQTLQHCSPISTASQMTPVTQVAPYVPWHAFPPAPSQPPSLSVNCNISATHHLPSPPHTRHSSRSPSLAHMKQLDTHLQTGARKAPVSSTTLGSTRTGSKHPRSSVGKRHRTSTERKIERKRAENANYIPRPRNSFIIFRTDFVAKHKKEGEAAGLSTAAVVAASAKARTVSSDEDDGDARSLSKQASEVWNKMTEAQKAPWQERAEQEKKDHARKYPNYRYRPSRNNSTQGVQCPGLATSSPIQEEDSAAPETNGSSDEAPVAPTREEIQKRRCDLVFDLMRQGYRGAELTSALMVYEGNFLPPNYAEDVSKASVAQCLNSAARNTRPTPLLSTSSRTPRSSSLSCALHMPIPRSPSVPLFNSQLASGSSMQAMSAPTPRSCPTTPQVRADALGNASDATTEPPSDVDSPLTSASSVNPPPQSMPPSPGDAIYNPFESGASSSMRNIYSYEKPSADAHETERLHCDLSSFSESSIPTLQPLALPRPPLEMVAELWAHQNASTSASTSAIHPMAPYLSLDYLDQTALPPTDIVDGYPTYGQSRFLTGLPSPPLSSTELEQISTGVIANDHNPLNVCGSTAVSTSGELEAYHIALGQAYANEVGPIEGGLADYHFDLEYGLGGVLPESTISFSDLGGNAGRTTDVGLVDLDVDMDCLSQAGRPYDHITVF